MSASTGAPPRTTTPAGDGARRRSPGGGRLQRLRGVTLTAFITYAAAAAFVLLVVAVLGSVLVESLGGSWRSGWWPDGGTLEWYRRAWATTGVARALVVTFEVGVAVVALSLVAGVPAGYALARKNFPGKSALMLVLLLPIILPQITYATQLAALMYRVGLGGSLTAVILVNVVPALPLVILITVPYVEQVNPAVEDAARVFGAGTWRLFTLVLVPLLLPGVAAAGVLTLVRVLGSFELTFFVSSADTQTLVVTIFGALSNPGGVAAGLTAAMTVHYMVVAVVGLAVSLRFANPVQALSRR